MEHWAKKKKNEEAENQFQRLPDDVVLHILDKVSDIKWLCRCFMVSKRFSSLIPRVQTLSVNSNIWDSFLKSCSDSHNEGVNNTHGPIRSLNLELISDFDVDDDSVFKWGAKFMAELDSITFLCAKSLSRMMKSEADEDATENEIAQEELFHSAKLAIRCLEYAFWWLRVLSQVFAKFPMLESVTITDWKNKGVKLCLGGEKLVECRHILVTKPPISPKRGKAWWQEQGNAMVGYVPGLQLPISGYVMKGVTIVYFKMSDNDFEAATAMLDAFAEDQGPFLEAVVQILEKHKDSIKAFF
ncbi:hypothetical protein RHGRI_037986 [Rhododendron griersonianum]|uniref:F-box domain-containing protein n=1 Tax=Rhododendron griersonianum TaxID=479676 RepID=A0AAV6HWP5_9ERIC|nr:hypothetical protein RHGRI_037986 [Rhododendron griersonianum]